MSEDNRNLTDADVEAIIEGLLNRLRIGVGKSVLDSVWKAMIAVMLAIALYGLAAKGGFLPSAQSVHTN